ncbi:hypothetical protein FNV43_RR09659 [Rhamnella rubrinervis]|uniref:Uncharacterized protein n=1 Tax=Rhamnella rubrinervis TaxID=2594499 RepID=A0A8K0MK02_9ROSA|nr:hypothetical protein FNV43_RR09659 [Rhamnella rubrinervis]
MYSRIHPSSENTKYQVQEHATLLKAISISSSVPKELEEGPSPFVLTVWKRSSMSFQGTDGFTVFDDRGRLTFRVDNYSRKSRWLVLMDGAGRALLTLKPQVISMQKQWNAYRGDQVVVDGYGKRSSGGKRCSSSKVFSMRSSNKKNEEADVFLHLHGQQPTKLKEEADFRIGGCFRKRNCIIRSGTSNGQLLVAYIARKKVNNSTILLGDDVFSLVVQPGFDIDLIMAFVIVLDRICGNSYAPLLCS